MRNYLDTNKVGMARIRISYELLPGELSKERHNDRSL